MVKFFEHQVSNLVKYGMMLNMVQCLKSAYAIRKLGKLNKKPKKFYMIKVQIKIKRATACSNKKRNIKHRKLAFLSHFPSLSSQFFQIRVSQVEKGGMATVACLAIVSQKFIRNGSS